MKNIKLLDFIQNNMRSGFMDAFMPMITMLGDNGAVWVAAAVNFLLIRKYRRDGIAILFALLLSVLIGNMILKPLVARIRPCDVNTAVALLIPHPNGYSFPSAHTMSSFAAATVIFLRHKRLGIIAGILAAAIAFSRMYLYVHYLSDVAAGIIIGVSIGVAVHFVAVKNSKTPV